MGLSAKTKNEINGVFNFQLRVITKWFNTIFLALWLLLILVLPLPFHLHSKLELAKIKSTLCLSRFEPVTILTPIQYITIQPTHLER